MPRWEEYRAEANTVTSTILSTLSIPMSGLTDNVRVRRKQAHLTELHVTVRGTAATTWARIGIGSVNTGSSTDVLAVTLAEGVLRGAIPAHFGAGSETSTTEESLNWEGEYFLNPDGRENFVIRLLIWTQMGVTVTYSVRAVVRYND